MKCTICGRPITLAPSAKERAAKDVSGKNEAYYRSLFTEHTECTLKKRNDDVAALMRSMK